VHAAPVDNEEAIHHHSVDACRITPNFPGIFELMRLSMTRSIQACIDLMEDILITYYKCTLSAVTYKLTVSGQMLIWTFFLFRYVKLVPKFVRSFQLHPVHSTVSCGTYVVFYMSGKQSDAHT
jgi:hypothetical protein